jgi:hypothetical protein
MEKHMSTLEKLRKNTTIKESAILARSKFFTEKDMVTTSIPVINIALSGDMDGGLTPGLTMWAGVSKHFKTGFSLLMAKAYLEKYKDAALLFYDSEFGTPQAYFSAFGIDMERVLHTPVTDVEQLKFDIMKQLKNIDRGDKIIIIVDSIGNLASKKEVEDALNEKSVADMSRAKQLKSLFRMVTPHLTIKDIPMVVVGHTYKEMSLFPRDIVSGGTGSYYAADNIFIIGRQQDKKGKELLGHNFIINVEKSRYVKEKSKIPVSITFEGGINKWTGLLDIAIDGGFVHKPTMGWYSRTDLKTGELEEKKWRIADTSCSEFWNPIINSKEFKDYIKKSYQISHGSIITDEEVEDFIKGEEVV